MVCITKPCSHRPRNVAKLKIYLSIFCTTNGLLHASSTHAHLLHALSTHTLSMHHPCTPYPCIIHAHLIHASSMHTHLPVPMDTSMHHPRTHTCLFLWTPPCVIHAHTPSACVIHAHLPASCMHTLYAACLPVAVMSVPIQVRVDGQGNLCPSQKGASNDLTRFVAAEVVEQYSRIMNCSTCSLSGVQLTSCSSE